MLAMLLTLSLSQSPDTRKTAEDKYATILRAAEKKLLETELRNAKVGRSQNSVVAAAQERLDLWKAGLLKPDDAVWYMDTLPPPDKMKVGDVGKMFSFRIEKTNKDGTALVRVKKAQSFASEVFPTPAIVRLTGARLIHTRFDDSMEFLTACWVCEVRESGGKSIPVIEPIP